jgi:hypothetical protein
MLTGEILVSWRRPAAHGTRTRLGRNMRHLLLGVEHHLLIGPLSELGVRRGVIIWILGRRALGALGLWLIV